MKKADLMNMLKSYLKKIKSDKKVLVIILVGALIMLTVLLADIPKGEKTQTERLQSESYEQELEERLCRLISDINGAGKVRVMLTFESTVEAVYAFDSDETIESKGNENSDVKTKNEYIILKRDGNEGGLQLKDIYPKVRGAAVVCEGADDPIVKGRIISVICALFDINSTNISVAGMAD